jgi:DNA-binding SARP family transcriptional activator/predicted ATPase
LIAQARCVLFDAVPGARTFRLELLGGFRLIVDGAATTRPLTARQQQLLAYLALNGGGPIPRQQIAGRLWPDSGDAQALTNLRREWHHLRENWPELDALLDAGTRTLGWRPEALPELDVSDFERAAGRGLAGDRSALDEAARLYRGDLLPHCADEWIHADRERLRVQALQALTRLVDLLEQEQAHGDAIERGQQVLRIDPLNERAWCALMRCHAHRGERATALHLYQQCASLLKQELDVQPSAATRRTYREILDVDDAAAPASALVPPRTVVYPLAGRKTEWAVLRNAWQAASAGGRRLLLIRGEAGIGKTRLAEELVEWCRSRGGSVVTTRCYAGDGRLAYAPIGAWLQSEALRPTLTSLDAVWLTDIARLRPELLIARPDVPAPEPQLETWQRSRFFDALSHVFEAAAPLLLVVDDLQWSDADTLDWFHYFLRSPAATRCLIVGTVRAEEEQDNRPLRALVDELERLERLTLVTLGPLDEAASARLADEVAEHPLDPEVQAKTFRETEGQPLFIIERGRMESSGGSGEAALSPRVQSVVAARLARLSDEARAVAEVAAAIGRDFTFDIVAQVSDLEEDAVVRALDELWRRHVVRVQAGERWDFSHDRIREVAYGSIGPARSRLIHRRIAQALERAFASDLDRVSAPIATHLDRGGQPARAIPFLERAAQVAIRVSAIEEGIRCLTYALSLLDQTAPGRDRDERELSFRATLSSLLTYARGYASVESEQNLERVVTLARALGRGEVPVRWWWALWSVYFVLGDLERAREAARHAMEQSRSDPSSLCEAHHAMAGALIAQGELDAAHQHFEAAIAAYDESAPRLSAFGSDLGVFAHAWSAHALWLLGDAGGAIARAEEAIALARRLGHVYSETLALAYAGLTHQFQRDIAKVSECASAVVALSDRYGFAYYRDWADVLLGWVSGQEGRPEEGVHLIERALAHLDAQRAQGRRPYYLSLLAETLMAAGHRGRAASALDTAVATALKGKDVWWLPELLRLKSELEPPAGRERLLRQALETAREQHSRSLERRIVPALTVI